MVDGVSALSTAPLRDEIRRFFAEHPIPQAGARLDQVLERLDVNVAFRTRVADQLAAALG